jgi:hypothetical protein
MHVCMYVYVYVYIRIRVYTCCENSPRRQMESLTSTLSTLAVRYSTAQSGQVKRLTLPELTRTWLDCLHLTCLCERISHEQRLLCCVALNVHGACCRAPSFLMRILLVLPGAYWLSVWLQRMSGCGTRLDMGCDHSMHRELASKQI